MQLGLNRCQQAAEATDLSFLVHRRTGPPTTLRVQAFSGGLAKSKRRLPYAVTRLMSPKLSPYWTLLIPPENEEISEVDVNTCVGLQPP